MTQKFTSDDHSSATTGRTLGSSNIAPAGSTGKDSLQSMTRELAGGVSHVAGGIADEAKKAAGTKLDAGKDFAAEHLGSVADALHKTSKSLGSDNVASEYIEKAANSVETVSEYFQTRTLNQLINDAEAYARREPAVFLGGAFFIGMLGGRFLKAANPTAQVSQDGRSQQSSQGSRSGGNGHERHSHGQNQGNAQHQGQHHPGQGNRSQQAGGIVGGQQGNKQTSPGQKGASASAESTSGSSDKSGKTAADRATEAGFSSPDEANRPGKGSGAS